MALYMVDYAPMKKGQPPTRLSSDPIVDCIIELRFKMESGSAVDVFPGVLYSYIKGHFPDMRNTPISEIPPKIRAQDENLKYQATVEFLGAWGRVLVADSSVQFRISCPYPGWDQVEPRAQEVLKCVVDTGLVSEYERISILYHNIIPTKNESHDLSPLELTLRIGKDLAAPPQGTLLRTELAHESGVTIVQVQSGATAKRQSPEKNVEFIRGIHLSVDTIALTKMHSFEDMKENLAKVHSIERSTFFKMLKEETWMNMGPIWE